MRLTNSEVFDIIEEDVAVGQTFVVNGDKYFVETGVEMNLEEEVEKLKKELDYIEGFIRSVNIKLSNEKFVNNAPQAVLDAERKKLFDSETRKKALEENLSKFL